jgi:tetratricopeptide (TPR) repeat protein
MAERASIVVRSMGRPELKDALASIAAQTWPDIEVVLVAASGAGHPSPPPMCGRFPIRYVPGTVPRPRPVAANAGLDAATGGFIGFLDDDDIHLPSHVEALAKALRAAPDSPAAYSIVREQDEAGALVRLRAQPFSRRLLHEVSYVGMNAALVRRSALATCRFDERFEVCEDWDFFLQLAEAGDFTFVPVETILYRGYLGTSDTGQVAQAASARERRFAALLAAKWEQRGSELVAAVDAAGQEAVEHFAAGRWDAAELAADRVLAAYPYEVVALNVKGTLLAQRGDMDGALARFRIAAQEAPDDVASRVNLAQALERSGRAADAISEYDRILTIAPNHPLAAARKHTLERQRTGNLP